MLGLRPQDTSNHMRNPFGILSSAAMVQLATSVSGASASGGNRAPRATSGRLIVAHAARRWLVTLTHVYISRCFQPRPLQNYVSCHIVRYRILFIIYNILHYNL